MEINAAKKWRDELVREGMASTPDEAAHMLVDMGEIDSDVHAELLTDAECERIYG